MSWSGGKEKINALWHSAHSSVPWCVIWEQSIRPSLCLNMGRVIRRGSNDWGLRIRQHLKRETGVGWARQPFIKANLEKTMWESILRDSDKCKGTADITSSGFWNVNGTKQAICWHYLGLWGIDQHFSLLLTEEEWSKWIIKKNNQQITNNL